MGWETPGEGERSGTVGSARGEKGIKAGRGCRAGEENNEAGEIQVSYL